MYVCCKSQILSPEQWYEWHLRVRLPGNEAGRSDRTSHMGSGLHFYGNSRIPYPINLKVVWVYLSISGEPASLSHTCYSSSWFCCDTKHRVLFEFDMLYYQFYSVDHSLTINTSISSTKIVEQWDHRKMEYKDMMYSLYYQLFYRPKGYVTTFWTYSFLNKMKAVYIIGLLGAATCQALCVDEVINTTSGPVTGHVVNANSNVLAYLG
jgi:hypothetical protein